MFLFVLCFFFSFWLGKILIEQFYDNNNVTISRLDPLTYDTKTYISTYYRKRHKGVFISIR